MIGIKLARAAELLNGKTPKNKSVDDTMLDNFVYAGLFAAYIKEKRISLKIENCTLEPEAKEVPLTKKCRICETDIKDSQSFVIVQHGSGYGNEEIKFCKEAHKQQYINTMMTERGMRYYSLENTLAYI